MNNESKAPTAALVHGYPNLHRVKRSLKALRRHFLASTLSERFPRNIPRSAVALVGTGDLTIAVQKTASAIATHLRLPSSCILVAFRGDLERPGQVELTREEPYVVEIHSRYREHRRDIAAILAHEITHVFLHRAGLSFPDVQEHEILTDVAAVYLGVGWLTLDAYRKTEHRHEEVVNPSTRRIYQMTAEEKLGYLTPEEFGYVLAKRSLAFQDKPHQLFSSPAARVAFALGQQQAVAEHTAPPLLSCGPVKRILYCWQRWRAQHRKPEPESAAASASSRPWSPSDPSGTYRFERREVLSVVFECPLCSQKLRLPVGKGSGTVHCANCATQHRCWT